MYQTLCGDYRDSGWPRKKTAASKPPKRVILKHVWVEFIIYNYQHKGDQAIIDRTMFMDLRDNFQPFLRGFNHLP